MTSYPVGKNLPENYQNILEMAEALKKKNYSDVVLICSGSSGAIISAIIAIQFNPILPIIYIKKAYERNHGHFYHSMRITNKTLIIVDDFVATGDTIRHIRKKLRLEGITEVQGICMSSSFELYDLHKQGFFKDYIY